MRKNLFLALIAIAAVMLINGCIFEKEEVRVELNKTVNNTIPSLENANYITETVLIALNNGTYSEFSGNFSEDVKKMINESEFYNLRNIIQNTSGNYINKTMLKYTDFNNYDIYEYNCNFEREVLKLRVALEKKRHAVSGIYFDSNNLRKIVGMVIREIEE